MKPVASSISLNTASARPWWLWLNVLSLDAALVAVVWQEGLAQAAGVELGWVQRVLLAVCAWLAYAGDRLLDARRLAGPVDSARHEFARVHARSLGVAWGIGLLVAIGLAGQLPLRELLAGLGLAAVVGLYFLLQHHGAFRVSAGCGKELMAGAGFAAGTLFFVVMNAPVTVPLLLLGLAWAGLCGMNCLLIAGWDRARDAAMGQPSMARGWPGLERALPWLAMAPPALAMAAAMLDGAWLPLAVALTGSALALLELARRASGMDSEVRRVWADAVLLTPILILW